MFQHIKTSIAIVSTSLAIIGSTFSQIIVEPCPIIIIDDPHCLQICPQICPPVVLPPVVEPPIIWPPIVEPPVVEPPVVEPPEEPECPCEGEEFSKSDSDTQPVAVDAAELAQKLATELSSGFTIQSGSAAFSAIRAMIVSQLEIMLRKIPNLPQWFRVMTAEQIRALIRGIVESQLSVIERALDAAIKGVAKEMEGTALATANAVLAELKKSDAEFSGTYSWTGCDDTGSWNIDETSFTQPSAGKAKTFGVKMKPKIKMKLDAIIAGLEVEVQIELIVTFKVDVNGSLEVVGTTGPTPANKPSTTVGAKPKLTLAGSSELHTELGGLLVEAKSKSFSKKLPVINGNLSVDTEDCCKERPTPKPEPLPERIPAALAEGIEMETPRIKAVSDDASRSFMATARRR